MIEDEASDKRRAAPVMQRFLFKLRFFKAR